MIRNAIRESKKSKCRARHGAAVVRKKSVLGVGHNSYRSHPNWGSSKVHSGNFREFFTVHAEAAAIRAAVNKRICLTGATIYVARGNVKGGSQMSRPCKDCQKLIARYGISKVVYTDKAGNIITEWP